jgi:hypothetical protein
MRSDDTGAQRADASTAVGRHSEAERAKRKRPRKEASGRSDVRSDDAGAQRGVARYRAIARYLDVANGERSEP